MAAATLARVARTVGLHLDAETIEEWQFYRAGAEPSGPRTRAAIVAGIVADGARVREMDPSGEEPEEMDREAAE